MRNNVAEIVAMARQWVRMRSEPCADCDGELCDGHRDVETDLFRRLRDALVRLDAVAGNEHP